MPTWDNLVPLAETHGLGPLLYTHLRTADGLPRAIKRELQGLYLRHRHAGRVREQALAQILDAFQAKGIEVLVLKGAALAQLVYPEPGLRPMRDVDLLVSQHQARQAQKLLAGTGFHAPQPDEALPDKHLPVAQRTVEGFTVSIEIHHNLYSSGSPDSTFEALRPAAAPFSLNGTQAWLPGPEDMLSHIYKHMRINILHDSLRLIWITDLVGLAEHYAGKIDWAQTSPRIRNALALCHWIAPLSPKLIRAAGIDPGHCPPDLDCRFQGWPRFSLAVQRQRHKSYQKIALDSFFPPEWWVRLYYGAGSGGSLWWHRRVKHPLKTLQLGAGYLLKK